MRWSRTIQLVDVHCEGEIGRVVTGGVLDIPGANMGEKLAHLNGEDNHLRRFLTMEPRGVPAGSVVVLTPPTRSEADAGFVLMQSDRAHAMSGSNAICATVALLETGMLPMSEPESEVVLDTAAGLVRTKALCSAGRCEEVRVRMPVSFVELLDASIETKQWGKLRYDICFGGVFYALVDVAQLGIEIAPSQARVLAEAGVALCREIDAAHSIQHPEQPKVSGLAYVMFRQKEDDGALRTCTTIPLGRVDRSPCGTGSVAHLAAMRERGEIKVGEEFLSRSIIDGEFRIRFLKEAKVGERIGVVGEVGARGWIYGLTQMGLDPSDPFPLGFTLPDTWGG